MSTRCSPRAFLICFVVANCHVFQENLSFDSFPFFSSKPSAFPKGLGKLILKSQVSATTHHMCQWWERWIVGGGTYPCPSTFCLPGEKPRPRKNLLPGKGTVLGRCRGSRNHHSSSKGEGVKAVPGRCSAPRILRGGHRIVGHFMQRYLTRPG